MKKILLFIILSVSWFQVVSQVDWPFPTSNQQAHVAGSIGEYRYTATGSQHRFHKGVDLTNGAELSIHSINTGIIDYNNGGGNWNAWTSWVSVGNVFYYHMKPCDEIINGTLLEVTEVGTYLGELLSGDGISEHLHLQEGDGSRNYLNNALSPYIDNSVPFFCDDYITINNGVAFYQNGLTKNRTDYANLLLNDRVNIEGTEYTKLYNKIDIAAHVKDYQTNSDGSGNTGQIAPYEISWRIRNRNSNLVINDQRFTFNTTPNNNAALYCFHPQSVHAGSPSIHILTSHISQANYDRYWNTNLRSGVTNTWPTDNSLDAYYGLDARTPDDIYTVEINSFDVDYNDNPNQNATQETINILM